MKPKILLVGGHGNVGSAAPQALITEGWTCDLFPGKEANSSFRKQVRNSDAGLITISTKDTGEAELNYIQAFLELGKPVATCAKGALAWHFAELQAHLPKIGYSAVVGGKSGMLRLLNFVRTGDDPIERIVAIPNTTLNSVLCQRHRGVELETTWRQAEKDGLCEPGSGGMIGGINREIRDGVIKLAIIFTFSQLEGIVSPDHAVGEIFTMEQLHDVFRSDRNYRFVVSLEKLKAVVKETRDVSRLEAFAIVRSKWAAFGSFREDVGSLFPPECRISERYNAMVITTKSGKIQAIDGIGAGPVPVIERMIDDLKRLLGI